MLSLLIIVYLSIHEIGWTNITTNGERMGDMGYFIGDNIGSGKCLMALQLRHNGCDGVSNHHPQDCLLNRVFGRRPKKTSKLCVTVLCAGNSPLTGEFPAQMASAAENVSIWWRHHVSNGSNPILVGVKLKSLRKLQLMTDVLYQRQGERCWDNRPYAEEKIL